MFASNPACPRLFFFFFFFFFAVLPRTLRDFFAIEDCLFRKSSKIEIQKGPPLPCSFLSFF